MKVLMTGDTGFVGSVMAKHLDSYIGYSKSKGYDICDLNQLRKVVKENKPTIVLHLAAVSEYKDAKKNPLSAFETNVIGTRNVAEVCTEYNLPLIYASSGSVYMPVKRPMPITEEFECRGNSIYAMTKLMANEFVRRHTPHMILRYSHLYGNEKGAKGMIGICLDRIERGLKPIIYGGAQSNDFTYIKDIVRANMLALNAPESAWNQIYNIGTGEEITTEAAGRLICELTGYTGELDMREIRKVDADRFVYSIEKARKMLGYEPRYSFREGLKEMIKERRN